MLNQIDVYKKLYVKFSFSLYPLNYQGKETYDEGWSKWCYEKRPFDEAEFIIAPGVYKNCGVLCGPASKVIIIDIDDVEKFEAWCLINDIEDPLPETFTVKTRPGRYHYYYGYPFDGREYRPVHVDGFLDILAAGSLAVAPGSIHKKTKQPYQICNDIEIADLPEWARLFLLEKNNTKPSKNKRVVVNSDDGTIGEGGRNNHLTRIAGSLLNTDLDSDSIKNTLLAENKTKCNPPLDDSEVLQIHRSMTKKGSTKSYNLTDSGNAELFVDKCHDNIRYCPENKNWYVWLEGRWKIDDAEMRRNLAKEELRAWKKDGSKTRNKEYRDKLVKHTTRSENKASLENMTDLAKSFSQIHVEASDLDSKDMLLNVCNGTVDLRTGILNPHNKTDFFTRMLDVNFDSSATCPGFDDFMKSITGNDPELIEYHQKAFGYALTGDTDEQIYFILTGDGSNGKSTLLNVFSELMGHYAGNIDFNALCDLKFQSSKENQIAQTEGKRFVTSIEVDSRKNLDQTLINKITGGDEVSGKLLYKDSIRFTPKFKLFIACNHLPKISVNNLATWRRIRVIPFNYTFEGKNRINKLKRKLVRELPGILNWAVQGCLKWQKDGLESSQSVKDAIKNYQQNSDPVAKFLAECCVSNATSEIIKTSYLHKAYIQWCESNGHNPDGPKKFTADLISKGYRKNKVKSAEHWIGLQLKSNLSN